MRDTVAMRLNDLLEVENGFMFTFLRHQRTIFRYHIGEGRQFKERA